MQDGTQQAARALAEHQDLHLSVQLSDAHHALARRYLIAHQRRRLSRAWSLKALRLCVGVMAGLGAIGLGTFQPTSLEGARTAVHLSSALLLGAALLLWLQAAWSQRLLYTAEQEELRPFRVPFELTVREDALVMTSPLGQSAVQWAAVSRAEIVEGCLLISIAASDVLVIPPGCGASLEALKQRLDRQIAARRPLPPPTWAA